MTLNKEKVAEISFGISKVILMVFILLCYMGSTFTTIINQGHNGVAIAAVTMVLIVMFGWITFTIIKSRKPQVKEALASVTGVWIYIGVMLTSVVVIAVLTGLSF